MFAQCLSHLLHWFDLGAHGPSAPCIKKFASIVGADILPELLEVFLQKVGSDGTQIVLHQFGQFDVLFVSQVLTGA